MMVLSQNSTKFQALLLFLAVVKAMNYSMNRRPAWRSQDASDQSPSLQRSSCFLRAGASFSDQRFSLVFYWFYNSHVKIYCYKLINKNKTKTKNSQCSLQILMGNNAKASSKDSSYMKDIIFITYTGMHRYRERYTHTLPFISFL